MILFLSGGLGYCSSQEGWMQRQLGGYPHSRLLISPRSEIDSFTGVENHNCTSSQPADFISERSWFTHLLLLS